MIKHIVMWKFKEETTEEDKRLMKQKLEALKGVVPTLVDIEIGMNVAPGDAAKDMVLYSEFNSEDDLQAYAVHPEHQKVVEFVKPLVAERAVVDYEC